MPTARSFILAAMLAVAASVTLATSWVFAFTDMASPWPALSGELGSTEFRVVTFDWNDDARQRPVPARLFLPDDTARPLPLVLFSHGLGSSDDGYTHLGRFWANHGVASLHVRHVGSDRAMWEGGALGFLQRLEAATSDDEAVARALDLRFALDRMLSDASGEHIDTSRIVAAGHSYGANSAMLIAGARVTRAGRLLDFCDPRIAAAIVISAPPFYGEEDFEPILSGITMPTLHITTLDDVIRIPGFSSDVSDRRRVFDAMGGDRTLAIFDRGSHNVFTDRRYFDSAATADAVKASTQRLTLAFVQALESGGGDDRLALLSEVPGPGLVVTRAPATAVIERNARPLAGTAKRADRAPLTRLADQG